MILFMVCYSYQMAYIPLQWILSIRKKRIGHTPELSEPGKRTYAAMICGRNESKVIGDLIRSIHNQTYPQELITVFVLADNCTDNTAELSRSLGAVVYERENKTLIGKSYALDELLRHIKEDFPEGFDGYFVFDADNILAKTYIEEMDRKACRGYEILTSYRNSKNYGDNWISMGYSLWFIRESRYLNHARNLLHTSCAVSGTGFMFSRKIADELNGWPYHTLTEDIEFSVDQICKGRTVGMCEDAELYDEQPVKFRQSWRQRLRWAKGFLQVIRHYSGRLIKGIFKGNFSCFDMTMNIMPALIIETVLVLFNLAVIIAGLIMREDLGVAVSSLLWTLLNHTLVLMAVGAIAIATEWKHVRTTPFKKIWSVVVFPLFMFTYIPIMFASFFSKVEWKPIEHTVSAASMDERSEKERIPSAD